MIKQFVPSEFCLNCRNCCRFRDEKSVWSPCLLDEEIQVLLEHKIPPAAISLDRRLLLIPDPCGEGFICPFLNNQDNKCRIYKIRPFECALYPFLLNMRNGRVLLTVDLNCPYVGKTMDTPQMKDYITYLTAYLNSPGQLRMFKDNPQIVQAYEQVKEVAELQFPDGTK